MTQAPPAHDDTPVLVRLPHGAWCLWETERQLPRLLGRPWREHLAELSERVGLRGAAQLLEEALADEGRWARLVSEVDGEHARQAMKRLGAQATPSGSDRAIRADLARLLRPPLERWEEEREAKKMATIKAAQRAKEEERAVEETVENIEEVEEVEEEITPYAWAPVSRLVKIAGSPSHTTIKRRAQSSEPRWAHYEEAEAKEVEGDWHSNATHVYRLREGTTWDPLEVVEVHFDSRSEELPEGSASTYRVRAVAAEERLADAAREHKAEVAELRAELRMLEDQATAWRDERDKARAELAIAHEDYEALRQRSVSQKTEIDQLSHKLRRRDMEDDARRQIDAHAEETRRRMVAAEALLREMVESLEPGDDSAAWRALFRAARYLLELERSE